MNITFNLNQQDDRAQEFLDKAAWKAHCDFLNKLTPSEAPFTNTTQFPCMAIETGHHYDPDGPTQLHYFFIYKYTFSE